MAFRVGITGALSTCVTDQSRDVTTPLLGAAQPKRRSDTETFQLGDYQILGLLARGGTGGVYLASHIRTQQQGRQAHGRFLEAAEP